MPTISVIVPVYNTEDYLRRCVDSILSQTYPDFELLLVDDGSIDCSGQICDEYAMMDQRVKVFHQINQGQSVARNRALDWIDRNSDCKYIAFADSDDWMHPRCLELLYRAISKYHTKLSQCKWQATEGVIGEKHITEEILLVTPEDQYTKWFSAYPWGKLYDRSIFQTLRYPKGIVFEDIAIWYKILFSLNAVAIVNDELYYYYQRKDGTTNADWTPAKMSWVNAWDDNLAFAEKYNNRDVLKAAVNRACWVYKHEVEEINESTTISSSERQKYRRKVMKRLRITVSRHKQELKELQSFDHYYAFAFPRLHRLYWIGVGIRNKLKR